MLKPFTTTAIANNLQRLCIIRLILLVSIGCSLAIAHWQQLDIAATGMGWVLCGLALYTALCWLRLQQTWPVTEQEFFGHIIADILFLTALLYFSGGSTNPFVSFYLIPLAISATTLPSVFTFAVAGLSIGAYSLLLFFYIPVAIYAPSHHSDGLNIHILGMWINFVFSAGLITFFVVRMAIALRQQQQTINQQKEDNLRDEQIMAVATLAAGTAHELGTPLATMNVLLEELLTDSDETLQPDIELLLSQVKRCKTILENLSTTAQQSHAVASKRKITELIEDVVDHWQLMRPSADYQLNYPTAESAPYIFADTTLQQAITNLLNNAADACAQGIDISMQWNHNQVELQINDNGPGIPMKLAEQIGKPFITTKGEGLGLGLSLSHATVERLGGSITLYNRQQGGTSTHVMLPIAAESTND